MRFSLFTYVSIKVRPIYFPENFSLKYRHLLFFGFFKGHASVLYREIGRSIKVKWILIFRFLEMAPELRIFPKP